MTAEWLVVLSEQQQELLLGGQNLGVPSYGRALPSLVTTGGPPVDPLGKALKDGSDTAFASTTVRGVTNSGPVGSVGNSLGDGNGSGTGVQDSMILPPFTASNEIFF